MPSTQHPDSYWVETGNPAPVLPTISGDRTADVVILGAGPAERQHMTDRLTIQKDFDGPRTIAFINPKGGAAKTTGVLAAGYTFGTIRGGGVIAWDNNETRGTLGIRGTRSTHRNTTRELLGRPPQPLRQRNNRCSCGDKDPECWRLEVRKTQGNGY